MTTTVLTDEQIVSCICGVYESTDAKEIGRLRLSSSAIPIGRAIEQAVLQSEQVQAWKRDAERLKKACRIAVLALAHAHKERGEVYRLAYEEVDAAIRETQP